MITIGALLTFILENRKDKTFIDMSTSEIAGRLLKGVDEGLLLYSESDGKIDGMILAERDDKNKVMFVTENMAMSRDLLSKFATWCKTNYPGWTIEAMRHGKHRIFNTEKLYRKLHV